MLNNRLKRPILASMALLMTALAVLLWPGAGPAAAQGEMVLGTRDIQVTATRTEENIFDVPMTVNVITSEEIERQPYSNIVDILSTVPGLEEYDPGHEGEGSARIGIRGEEGLRTLILIDGVKIQAGKSHQSGSSAGMPMITADQIERIEIIKGPASVLYGAEAIGGVINIITKRGGPKPLTFGLRSSYDSAIQGYNSTAGVYGTTAGGVSYRVSANAINAHERVIGAGNLLRPPYPSGRGSTATTRNPSDYKNRYYMAQVGYDWDGNSVNLMVDRFENWTNSDRQYTNERDGITGTVTFRNLTPNLARLHFMGSLQDINIETLYQPNQPALATDINEHRSIQGGVQTDWLIGDHFLVAGIDYTNDAIGKHVEHATLSNPGEVRAEMTNLGLFAQDEWRFADGWRLFVGARNTWINGALKQADGRYQNIGKLPGLSHRESKLVANVGLVYTGIEDLALRATWSQGYNYPTLGMLFTGNSGRGALTGEYVNTPNPNLKPETSNSYEIGARMLKGGFSGDLAIYYSRVENYIESMNCEEAGVPCFGNIVTNNNTWVNRDMADNFGIELQLAYTFFDLRLTPYMNFTHTYRKFTDVATGFKYSRSGRAPYRGRFGLKWESDLGEHFTFFSDAYANWSSQNKLCDSRTCTQYVEPEWMTANLTVGVVGGAGHKYDVSLSLRNLFDVRYKLRPGSGTTYAYGQQVVVAAGVEW